MTRFISISMIYISNRLGQNSNALPDSCKSHLENTSIQIPLQKIPPCTARSWLGASSPPCRWDTPAPSSQSPPSTALPLFSRGSWLEFCKTVGGYIWVSRIGRRQMCVQVRREDSQICFWVTWEDSKALSLCKKKTKQGKVSRQTRRCTLAPPQRALHNKWLKVSSRQQRCLDIWEGTFNIALQDSNSLSHVDIEETALWPDRRCTLHISL